MRKQDSGERRDSGRGSLGHLSVAARLQPAKIGSHLQLFGSNQCFGGSCGACLTPLCLLYTKMNTSVSTFVISPVELKGLRCKISKKSRRRTRLFGWRKCSDSSIVDGSKDDKEELHPSMRAAVWCQRDESSKGVAAERILSYPMEVVSEDEDGGMIMTCAWPDGTKLHASNVSRDTKEEQVTLGLGIQVQNEELLSIGSAIVSFSGSGSKFLTFLPTNQSVNQVKKLRYEFDVSSTKLNTILDLEHGLEFGANWSHFVDDQLPNSKKSNVASLAENGSPKSEYAGDDWKLWETDDIKSDKVDDFSFEPAEMQMESVAAAGRVAGVKTAFEASNGKSTSTVATASTCSSTTTDMTREEDLGLTDITAEEGVATGCGSTLAELFDIITRRNCVQRNFELCLEEFFDAADENSFASETHYSVTMCREVRKSKKVSCKGAAKRNVDEQSLLANTTPMNKKKGFVDKVRAVEL